MKNKLAKISLALSFSVMMMLILAGCQQKQNPKQEQNQEQNQEQAEKAEQENAKKKKKPHYDNPINKKAENKFILDTAAARVNNILISYLNKKNLLDIKSGKKMLPLKIKFDALNQIAMSQSYFNCRESNPSMRRHEMYYPDAFYYVWNFAEVFNMLAYTEIPRKELDELISYTGGDVTNRVYHCGLHVYFGLQNSSSITMAYYPHANFIGIDARMWWPKPATAPPYYKSECQVTTPFYGTPDELDNILWGAFPPCNFAATTPIFPDDEIERNGNSFAENIYFQEPIGFFHALELRDLVTQNDDPNHPDARTRCASIRIYMGFEADPSELYRVRLVAFAVDRDGNNIMTTYDGYDAYILEHSWPPF